MAGGHQFCSLSQDTPSAQTDRSKFLLQGPPAPCVLSLSPSLSACSLPATLLGLARRLTHVILTATGLGAIFIIVVFVILPLQWWQLRFPESPGFTLLEDVRAESRSSSYDLFPFPGLAYPFSGSQGPHPTLLVAPGLYLVLTQFWPLPGHTHPTSSGIQTKPCRSHLAEMWQTREAALDT